jgi:hypothetical protein
MTAKEAQKRVDELMLELVEIAKANPAINIGFFTYSEELKIVRAAVVGDPVEVAKSMILTCRKDRLLGAVFCGAFAALGDSMNFPPPPPSEKRSDSSPVSETK